MTTEEELQEAIERIGKKPEARRSVKNSNLWKRYLTDVLGIHEESLDQNTGKNFWENVREGVVIERKLSVEPTEKQILEANAETEYYQKSATAVQTVYRNKETGKFMSSRKIAGLE